VGDGDVADWFLWLKAGHIVSIVAWMAGLFYLPRLFVYHTRFEVGSDAYQTFCVMERRLLKAIMAPAGIASWVLGVGCGFAGGYWPDAPMWLWMKIVLVVGMSGFHGMLIWHGRQFAALRNQQSERYFRMINEIPTMLLLGIVMLVVLRPF
jgi:putative membrane protein